MKSQDWLTFVTIEADEKSTTGILLWVNWLLHVVNRKLLKRLFNQNVYF